MSKTRKTESLAIVGGGPVGLALALALSAAKNTKNSRLNNIDIHVVERGALASDGVLDTKVNENANLEASERSFDNRVYAMSPSSVALLEAIGAWQHLPEKHVTPIQVIHVMGDSAHPKSAIHFDQGQSLAFIVEHRQLMAALLCAVRLSGISVIESDALAALTIDKAGQQITLASGRVINANLILGADGRTSPLRAMAGIDVVEKDYFSEAVIANFTCEKPHANTAWQWFSQDGVLAYLPLPENQISIVFSTSRANASKMCALKPSELATAIATAGAHKLGALTLASRVDSIALKRLRATTWVLPGLALIGDAAHAIHPLAGQGINLGFGDVAALVETLANKSPLAQLGDIALLRRYARKRAESAALLGEATDYLQALYQRDDAMSKFIRRQGFSFFNRSPLLKVIATAYAVEA